VPYVRKRKEKDGWGSLLLHNFCHESSQRFFNGGSDIAHLDFIYDPTLIVDKHSMRAALNSFVFHPGVTFAVQPL
jgi:hypothetical protein